LSGGTNATPRGRAEDSNPVFITGGTGYVGAPLIEALLARGLPVHALARSQSRHKLPSGAIPVIGDALDEASFADAIPPEATFVHLIGTPHPNPAKAAEFRRVDLASIQAAVRAARRASVRHLVYVSVAHPAPVMHAYIAVREEGERLIRESGIRATIVRPWYILGPGHWWPCVLLPVYAILRLIPATRRGAERLGLVTRRAMIAALVSAIESPPTEAVRVLEVPDIRRTTGYPAT
jgi:uncharacterized protein YbjT (DUF2867 family)